MKYKFKVDYIDVGTPRVRCYLINLESNMSKDSLGYAVIGVDPCVKYHHVTCDQKYWDEVVPLLVEKARELGLELNL